MEKLNAMRGVVLFTSVFALNAMFMHVSSIPASTEGVPADTFTPIIAEIAIALCLSFAGFLALMGQSRVLVILFTVLAVAHFIVLCVNFALLIIAIPEISTAANIAIAIAVIEMIVSFGGAVAGIFYSLSFPRGRTERSTPLLNDIESHN